MFHLPLDVRIPGRYIVNGRVDDARGRPVALLTFNEVLGPAPTDLNTMEIPNPLIVVEVLSPSTAADDHGLKLDGYFSLGSVFHYLILDPDRRVMIHHRRGQAGAIETRVLREGEVILDPPGFDAQVAAFFAIE